jgi:hypothetical protein
MKATLIALACIGSTPALAQRPPAPILDMHLHAGPADAQGAPPVRICAPFQRMATRDPRQSAEEYAAMLRQQGGCSSPLVSAGTDAELLSRRLRCSGAETSTPSRAAPGNGYSAGMLRLLTESSRDSRSRSTTPLSTPCGCSAKPFVSAARNEVLCALA